METVKPRYAVRLKHHLAEYKISELKTTEPGYWKGKPDKPYDHILPVTRQELNILPSIRKSFWTYFAKHDIELHTDFHHLNSSQAFSFNLFFPFLETCEKRKEMRVLPNKISAVLLGTKEDPVVDVSFEKVIDPLEETNFDVHFLLKSGAQTFLELKLTEQKFGAGKPDERRVKKWNEIYEPGLRKNVKPQFLEQKHFFQNYQLFRNILYLKAERGDHFFAIYPKSNEALSSTSEFLEWLKPDVRPHVHLLHFEELIQRITTDILPSHQDLKPWFEEFTRKYPLN